MSCSYTPNSSYNCSQRFNLCANCPYEERGGGFNFQGKPAGCGSVLVGVFGVVGFLSLVGIFSDSNNGAGSGYSKVRRAEPVTINPSPAVKTPSQKRKSFASLPSNIEMRSKEPQKSEPVVRYMPPVAKTLPAKPREYEPPKIDFFRSLSNGTRRMEVYDLYETVDNNQDRSFIEASLVVWKSDLTRLFVYHSEKFPEEPECFKLDGEAGEIWMDIRGVSVDGYSVGSNLYHMNGFKFSASKTGFRADVKLISGTDVRFESVAVVQYHRDKIVNEVLLSECDYN